VDLGATAPVVAPAGAAMVTDPAGPFSVVWAPAISSCAAGELEVRVFDATQTATALPDGGGFTVVLP
jgi:hypothetical protein